MKGKWKLTIDNKKYDLEFTTPSLDKDPLAYTYQPEKINAHLMGSIQVDNKKYVLREIKVFDQKISFTVDGIAFGMDGSISFNATVFKDEFLGAASDGVDLTIPFTAQRSVPALSLIHI